MMGILEFGFICPICDARYGEPKSRYGAEIVPCPPCFKKTDAIKFTRAERGSGRYSEQTQRRILRRRMVEETLWDK